MKLILKMLFVILTVTAVSSVCFAREASGKLGFIVSPSSTRPCFTIPGGTISIDVSKKIHDNCSCAFRLYILVDGQRVMLTETRRKTINQPEFSVAGKTDSEMGVYRYTATVPKSVPPGLYMLEAKKGANQDFTNRAIRVMDMIPDSYSIIHISNIYSDNTGSASTTIEKIADKANEIQPDIVVITGSIASESNPGEISGFIESLKNFTAPTIVVPEIGIDSYGKYFGSGNFITHFGNHLFIATYSDPENTIPLPEEERAIKWLSGIIHDYPDSEFNVIVLNSYTEYPEKLEKAISPGKADLFLNNSHDSEGFLVISRIENSTLSGQELIELPHPEAKDIEE